MLEPWVSEHPQRAREHLQEELLPAWGLGTTEDAGDLKRAVRIAKTLEDRQGDGSLLVLVEETRRATARGGSRLRRLKDAHASYGRGMELLDHRPGEATPELERAARLWKELGSPAEGWARIWSITSRYLRGTEDRRQLRRDLHRFRDLWDRSEVPLLRARGLWTDGHLASLGVALGDSLASYRQAYALFSSAGEIDHASFVAFLVAETYARLGNEASAWRWVERSLSIPGLSRSSERYPWTLIGIATLNTNEPVPEAALAFLAESLSLEAGPLATLEAHRHRARLMMEMGLHRRAEEEIREVSPLLRALDDSGLRRRVRAELLAVQARATAELSPHRALEMVEDAGSRLREIGLTNRTPRFALAASRAHRRLGQLERASTRLTGAVERLEREASKVTPAPEWNPVPAARELFDRLLDLGWSLEEAPESLLALAERGRLVGRAQLGDWEAIPGRLSRSLATNEGVVYFSTLPDRVLSWVITDSGVEMVQSPVSRGTLRSWVRATTRFLVSGRGAPPEGMTAAREGLLLPILERLPPEVDRITVVPDGPLHGLPFVALRDEKGRFLGDRFTLAIGLTATSLLKPDRRPAGRGPGERRALVLADPAFDQILFPDLPRLSGAREEGQAVAGLFRDSTLLTGTNATAERFRRLAPGHEIIHFAGHAVVNGHDPSRSNLLLASSPEMPGPLFVEDILDLPLESTELVILSSCSAGSGSPTGTGPASLARAFLEAGASRVVASLWPVSDQRASFILLDFHRRLREGLDPATALRRSQTELRHRGDSSTASWAAFQLYRS
ncbi:MAG: CHAT domain-containing protein [Thermoanaerobaculia bacterium]|nr:CHAT domain-containing protein [Thermoanaerobaculia bacterium]